MFILLKLMVSPLSFLITIAELLGRVKLDDAGFGTAPCTVPDTITG